MIRRLATAVRLTAGLLLAIAVSGFASATPAAAHAADADRASNYAASLVSVPDAEGLDVRLLTHGTQVEVTNHGDEDVIVLGYADEPYLRIGPDGVDENLQSYATYQNRSLTSVGEVPPEIDDAKGPEWHHVSDEPSYAWHDHRSHWMGLDPEAVSLNPDDKRVVMDDIAIPLLIGGVDGERAEIVVDVAYVPPPPLWPWLVGIGLGIVAIVMASWFAGTRSVGLVVGILLLGVTALDLVTSITASPVSPPVWWIAGCLVAAGALTVGVVRTARRDDPLGYALLGAGGLALAGLLGFVDRNWLVRSQLPTDLAPSVARTMVAASLALGVGLAVLAVVATLRPRSARAVSGTADDAAPNARVADRPPVATEV